MDTILVIDDERNIRTLVSRVLAQDDVEVHTAGTGKEGLELAEELSPDVSLVDLRLPDMDGIQVVRELKAKHPDSAVIMITAFGHIESAVAAIKTGATDYLEKPFQHLEKLRISVSRALDEVKARREITRLTKREEGKYNTDQLIGESDSTRRLRDIIGQLARSEAHTILIHGESGTGKELVAKGLHYESARRNFPFMEVNCAAITETLFESELFGHEKGAFTDARATKKGLMELADRGTLFLDEVGEMAPNSQAKLLRCLQERMFKRVGGTRDIKVDVRVIAATNRSLETMVKEGKFREDLFYRLNVIPITIPPLRERTEDILPLARHFLSDRPVRARDGGTAPRIRLAGQRPRAQKPRRAHGDSVHKRVDRRPPPSAAVLTAHRGPADRGCRAHRAHAGGHRAVVHPEGHAAGEGQQERGREDPRHHPANPPKEAERSVVPSVCGPGHLLTTAPLAIGSGRLGISRIRAFRHAI